MKKSKLIKFITLCFIGVFIVCTFISYLGASQDVGKNFNGAYNNVTNVYVKNEFLNADTVEEHFKIYENISVYALPKYICIFDKNGNKVMESCSYIERDGKYCILDDYLTDEMKTLLLSKQNKYSLKNGQYYFEVNKFEYALEGDKMIPVTISVTNHLISYEDGSLTLVLSDKEPTHSLPDGIRKYVGTLVLYDIDNNSYLHKVYEKMRENAYAYFEKNKDAFDSSSLGGGGCFQSRPFGTSLAYECMAFKTDGEDYMLVIQYEQNMLRETISSDSFKSLILIQTLLLLVVYIVCLVVALYLYRKNQRLEETKNAFIGAAAHELKTPISAIENYSECIIENINEEKNDEYIRNIHSESMRMGELVRSLLQYSRLASAQTIEKEKCSLTNIISEEAERYTVLANEKEVMLSAYIIPDAEINANEGLITLAVDNFLSNALRHTESGAMIEVSLEKKKNAYRVGVFNEGKNIPDDIIDNIWDSLSRADKARNSESRSTGMGLAVTKQIFLHHGCTYGAENKNDGVEFWFEIK